MRIAHIYRYVFIRHQFLVVLLADGCGEEKGAEQGILDSVIVACHDLREETGRLLGSDFSGLLSRSVFGVSITGVKVIFTDFVDTVSADVVAAELAVCLVREHAGHIRLELVGTIVTISLLNDGLQLIALLPYLNMLLLRRLIIEEIGKNGRQRVEVHHVGVLHFRVV
jgi:hypothetical protein